MGSKAIGGRQNFIETFQVGCGIKQGAEIALHSFRNWEKRVHYSIKKPEKHENLVSSLRYVFKALFEASAAATLLNSNKEFMPETLAGVLALGLQRQNFFFRKTAVSGPQHARVSIANDRK